MRDKIGFSFFMPLVLAALFVMCIVPLFLPAIAQLPQKYTDFIFETVAMQQDLNKTGEIQLFWKCMAISIITVIAVNYYILHKNTQLLTDNSNVSTVDQLLYLFGIPILLQFIFLGYPSNYFVMALLGIISLVKLVKNGIFWVIWCIFAYHVIIGYYSLVNIFSNTGIITEGKVYFILVVMFLLSFCAAKIFTFFTVKRQILFLQVVIPCILFVFLTNKYSVNNTIQSVPFPIAYTSIIYLLIAVLCAFSLYSLFKNLRKNNLILNDLILPSSVIAIFVFNSYTSPGLFFPTDWHHSAECFITWQQFFEFQKTLFDNYIPASGLFPMFFGFIQNILLDQTITAYLPTLTLSKIFVCSLSALFLYFIAGAQFSLVIALVFCISEYNRVFILFPCLLFIALPYLIERKNLWLQCWFIASLSLFLYYPLYGVAFSFGTFPFAVMQLRALVKTPNFKKILYSPRSYIIWIFCIILLAFLAPLIFRILRHLLTYGSQTTLADGIALFGRDAPPYFMPFIQNSLTKKILFYGTVYTIPIIAVLVFVSLSSLYYLKFKFDISKKEQQSLFLGVTAGIGMLCFIYTYSLIRMDWGGITFRSGPPMVAILGVFLPAILYKNGHLLLTQKTVLSLIGILFGISIVFNGAFPVSPASKIKYAYSVPQDFIRIDDTLLAQMPRVGNGFISNNDKATLNNLSLLIKQFKQEKTPILNFGGQLNYYAHNVNAAAAGAMIPARSFEAQNTMIRILERENPIIFWIDPFGQYYIYKWILKNGYLFSDTHCLIPREYPQLASTSQNQNLGAFGTPEVGYAASALGRSFDTLKKNFASINSNLIYEGAHDVVMDGKTTAVVNKQDPFIVYRLDKEVSGIDADFLHISLSSPTFDRQYSNHGYFERSTVGRDYKITIYWETDVEGFCEKNKLTVNYGEGELLIPLGIRYGWATSTIRKIRVDFEGTVKNGDVFSIKHVELLKWNK